MDEQQRKIAAYCGAFVDELSRSGVEHVVISPGSRSTPLAMLFNEHPRIRIWMHIDERSAAFFALGMAKAMRKPVALLCTSGTAAANYYPAIVEAKLQRTPLVVLTADRPHELRDVGAPQAIDQVGMYGSHVKWFVDMSPAENSTEMLMYVRQVAARAVGTANMGPSGPVHLNFPFREPFIPDIHQPGIWDGGRNNERQPRLNIVRGEYTLQFEDIERIAEELIERPNGLIVCGPQDHPLFPKAVTELANKLQYPIIADPLSQVRSGDHDKSLVIDGYDAFLREERFVERFHPDVIIRFGANPVSKALSLYLKQHASCKQIVVDSHFGWRDPTLTATEMIYADTAFFCVQLAKVLSSRHAARPLNDWVNDWLSLNELTQRIIREGSQVNTLFEGRVMMEVVQQLPDGAGLFVGNSMPVRDLDTFFMNTDIQIRTFANRGANGIDGVVSSALGASTELSPFVLVVGDLSFYHDLNGLLAAKLYELDVTIVVINNDGGGIFSFLPQAQYKEQFETLYGTPHALDFSYATKMYGGTHTVTHDWDALRTAVQRGIASRGLHVIEVRTDRVNNKELHRSLWNKVCREVRHSIGEE